MKPQKASRQTVDNALTRFHPATRLVFIFGPDEAQAREIADRFTRLLAPADDPTGRVDIDPAILKADPARLADEAAAVSMFGGMRLIRVDGAGEDSAPAVAALLDAPAAGNPVIMLGGTPKPTSALLKLVTAAPLADVFQCYPPEAAAASTLVAEACAAHGLRPTRAAQALLAAAFSSERGVLGRELEKLALYLDAEPGRETVLDLDAIEAVGAVLPDADFGGLVDAVAGGNPAETERHAARLDANGIAGIAQLRAVARRLLLLAELRAAIDAGRGAREAVDAARPPVFWKEKERVVAQTSAWSAPLVRRSLSHLLTTERLIKSSGSAPPQLLTAHALAAIARLVQTRKRRIDPQGTTAR